MVYLADHQDEKVVCVKVERAKELSIFQNTSRVDESLPAGLVALGGVDLLLQGSNLFITKNPRNQQRTKQTEKEKEKERRW